MPDKKELKIIADEKLSKHSTFQIGGPADFFYRLEDPSDLIPLFQFAKKKKIPYFIMGGGSNILFDDKGFRGLIIKIENKNLSLSPGPKGSMLIKAGAGVSIAALLDFSVKNNLSGLEKWVGLPGTVGGAVYGNAGCNGLETREILVEAEIVNEKNARIRKVTNNYFNFKYRQSKLKASKEIVISATFKLEKRTISAEEQKKMMSEIRQSRIAKQPFGASTGSFFKNPSEKRSAGLLIEQAELKGKTIGKAQISTKHGNFLVNLGGATCQDVLKLARFARQTIKLKFGLTLQEEVQILSANGLQKL
jgi:UDP-N-acetylmuramate dehydrogenase